MAAKLIGVYYPTRFLPLSDTAAPFIATDPSNGNQTPNDGATILQINNSDASTHTLTIQIPGGLDGQTVSSRVFSLTAGQTITTGAFPVNVYSNLFQYTVGSGLMLVRFWSLL